MSSHAEICMFGPLQLVSLLLYLCLYSMNSFNILSLVVVVTLWVRSHTCNLGGIGAKLGGKNENPGESVYVAKGGNKRGEAQYTTL